LTAFYQEFKAAPAGAANTTTGPRSDNGGPTVTTDHASPDDVQSSVQRDITQLTGQQADGLACVVCGADYLTERVAHRPVGRSHTGSQVFACSLSCADKVGDVA
jgi:hypothetical protein